MAGDGVRTCMGFDGSRTGCGGVGSLEYGWGGGLGGTKTSEKVGQCRGGQRPIGHVTRGTPDLTTDRTNDSTVINDGLDHGPHIVREFFMND